MTLKKQVEGQKLPIITEFTQVSQFDIESRLSSD